MSDMCAFSAKFPMLFVQIFGRLVTPFDVGYMNHVAARSTMFKKIASSKWIWRSMPLRRIISKSYANHCKTKHLKLMNGIQFFGHITVQ